MAGSLKLPRGDSSPTLDVRLRAIPGRLARLIEERSQAEIELAHLHAARMRRAEEARVEALRLAEEKAQSETTDLEQAIHSTIATAKAEFAQASEQVKTDRATLLKTAEVRFLRTRDEITSSHEAGRWEAGTVYETTEKGATEWLAEARGKLAELGERLQDLKDDTVHVLSRYQIFVSRIPDTNLEVSDITPEGDPFPDLAASLDQATGSLLALENLRPARIFHGVRILVLFALPFVALVYPLYLGLGPLYGVLAALGLSLLFGGGLTFWVVKSTRAKVRTLDQPLIRELGRCDLLMGHAERFLQKTHADRVSNARNLRDQEFEKLETLRTRGLEQAQSARDQKVADAEANATLRLSEIVTSRDRILQQSRETEITRRSEIAEQREVDLQTLQTENLSARSRADAQRVQGQSDLANLWRVGLAKIQSDVEIINQHLSKHFPNFSNAPPDSWNPPQHLPDAIPVGRLTLDLHKIQGGLPADETLRRETPDRIELPTVLDFPAASSVLFEAGSEAAREWAILAMQSVMLRFLTGLPAAKVRFTILDPVGLGRNFAGFMHLADFSEALVNGRIWTEPQQIDQRLTEINLHIETVIQNYLRNEFSTIEQYNEQAAEVAEPYRVLVVADFPSGFTEATARRLVAIAKSGPRCGVYLILGLDTTQPLPPGITRSELASHAIRITWKDSKPVIRLPELESYPLELDSPPGDEVMTRWLHRIGQAAQNANRVEVPFEVIAPKPENYWTSESDKEVAVPLGRAGATKLQPLSLGRGTSQHALIAGRTGSGKSTLLHALITNAALMYHPDELELYLIDFKKGVEFKTYATHKLPHARVVAIESEREFGLSVLQRLDQELRTRGDLFRDLGVQDLAGFRAARPDVAMPRTLFIVDEFQEYFVEDDKLAQEASLLLDRLVRQGRAFGIHVILGSQTLSGAYSLARSTLGQMAVRIALQCSEADAQLILNEDNAAARLLSRPGEAIYNDANGQSEGNHIFQVVWLPDARREVYLNQITAMAAKQEIAPRPTIVFEGNVPSELARHPRFAAAAEEASARPQVPSAILGEAVAIKEPTAAAFRSQGGSNLLVIGQNEEMAVGLLTASLLGLSAECGPASRFFLIDGTPEDSSFAETLPALSEILPQGLQVGRSREVASVLGEVAAEVERRQAAGSEASAWFLFIHDLSRFRDLRKADDDFSFSRRGEEKTVSAAKMLGNILRDGPPLGIHVVIWCDSLNNANRSFDRQAMREFEMRVLFQMSPADSSNLIDSPVANRLGANRALFASEEQGRLEKFRPYGLPSEEWLKDLGRRWKSQRDQHSMEGGDRES